MKKITLLMIAIASLATMVACKGEEEKPKAATITATPSSLECDSKGGDKTFTLKASDAWTISDVPAFATVSPMTGEAGDKITITVTFKVNEGEQTLNESIKASLNSNAKKTTTIKLTSLSKSAGEVVDYANVQNYMVEVEGGTFEMSTLTAEEQLKNAETNPIDLDPYHRRHQVTLSSFSICKYEATQEAWLRVMGTEPSVTGGTNPNTKPGNGYKIAGGAVVYVMFAEICEFLNKLSTEAGLTPYYTITGAGKNNIAIPDPKGKGFRLPTESEWEYAARGGKKTQGHDLSGGSEDDMDDLAWYDANCNKKVNTVGKKIANELGLYDMSGNVWEVVWDYHGEYPTEASTDPMGPSNGESGIQRGGSWYVKAAYALRPEVRLDNKELYTDCDDDRGFRIACYK